MHPSSSSSNAQQRSLGKIDEQQQALLALQQLGMSGWPIQSLLQNFGRGLDQQQQNEYFKQLMKTTNATSSTNSFIGEQQRMERELSQKKPSLIHDFGGNSSQTTRYSLIQPHLQQVQLNQSLSGFGATPLSDASYLTEDEEKLKRILNEKLEKIDRERSHAATMQKNAEKKAKTCEKLLAKAKQEPSFMAGITDNEDAEEDRDGISPTDALIERIYAENRRKAATAASSLPALSIPSDQQASTSRELMAEDAARLAAEYERGVQLLPMLVQAMRIQRERRQDALERRRIIYEEQLVAWERRVIGYEKNQKKLLRDVKHREIFEKTFVELKKMREEKERNNRVERARFSLTQGGNGLGTGLTPAPSSAAANGLAKIDESSIQSESNEVKIEQQEIIDEKMYAAALIPSIFSNPPRRYFDNRNVIVENALTESRTQLEAFQNAWTDTEKSIFNEKIAIYGKNFAAIAAFIPTKSVKECVQFYYMTKKRNNYKQKLGRRRKKIGRQGYRPPVMPRFGDTDENFQNYRNGCSFVECLLCDSRILVLESLAQQNNRQAEHFGNFNANDEAQANYQKEIAICTKCLSQAQRNKTLNRCPLGSCICVGGKRKMKSARNIPEKFGTLGIDHKRFIIYRLKMPLSATKCCTNCFKRISKDIDELLMGQLQTEFEAFKNRAVIIRTHQPKPALIIDGVEEEEEGMEHKPSTMAGIWADAMEGQPPLKEMKIAEGVEVKKELEFDEKMAATETGSAAAVGPLFVPQGSITKGTPNRTRSTLLGSVNETFEQPPPPQQHILAPTKNVATNLLLNKDPLKPSAMGQIDLIGGGNAAAIEELTSGLLSQFGLNVQSKEAAIELSRQLSGMLGTLPAEWLNTLQAQAQAANIAQQSQAAKMTDENVATAAIESANAIAECVEQSNQNQARRNSEVMRRKSGLATAILPSSIPESATLPTTNSNRLNAPRGGTAATTISPAFPTRPELLLEKEKPLLEQRDSNLTTNSGETLQKTDSTQGQLSSCYESLSDDSEDENCANNNLKQNKGEKQTATTTTKTPPAPLPAFFTVFDFQDEPTADEGAAADSSSAQMPPISNYFPTTRSTQSAAAEATAGMNKGGGGANDSIYEPLSSDEEN